MTHPRIYLQVGDTAVTWCEHRVHDSDVEYVIADPGERAPAVIASNFSCPRLLDRVHRDGGAGGEGSPRGGRGPRSRAMRIDRDMIVETS